jgi:hypothetical protein
MYIELPPLEYEWPYLSSTSDGRKELYHGAA